MGDLEVDIRLENGVDPALSVQSDPALLRRIVANRIGNAAQYTEVGGRIAVTSAPADGLLLAVTDSGPPIPAPDLERIFDRFVRLDVSRAQAGHAGIGLHLARAACTALGLHLAAGNDLGGSEWQVAQAARLEVYRLLFLARALGAAGEGEAAVDQRTSGWRRRWPPAWRPRWRWPLPRRPGPRPIWPSWPWTGAAGRRV